MDESVKNKIIKLKELCENGIGGEKENALKLYNELILKYEINEKELDNQLSRHNFIFENYIEGNLLIYVFYHVIGDLDYSVVKLNNNKDALSAYTTQLEADEITFLFNFYRYYLEDEVLSFVNGFCNKQGLFPDTSARRYKEGKEFLYNVRIKNEKDETYKDDVRVMKYAQIVEKRTPIHEGIEK